MQTYNNCFIGFSLPRKFEHEFENLIDSIKKIDNEISTVNPSTAHITLYYLNKQTDFDISEILEILDEERNKLINPEIIIKEIGYFYNEFTSDPRVIFLKIKQNEKLFNLQNALKSKLKKYNELDEKLFVPHLTIARIKNTKSTEQFKTNQIQIEKILSDISWSFQLSEISIYAKKESNEHAVQQKVGTIKIN